MSVSQNCSIALTPENKSVEMKLAENKGIFVTVCDNT